MHLPQPIRFSNCACALLIILLHSKNPSLVHGQTAAEPSNSTHNSNNFPSSKQSSVVQTTQPSFQTTDTTIVQVLPTSTTDSELRLSVDANTEGLAAEVLKGPTNDEMSQEFKHVYKDEDVRIDKCYIVKPSIFRNMPNYALVMAFNNTVHGYPDGTRMYIEYINANLDSWQQGECSGADCTADRCKIDCRMWPRRHDEGMQSYSLRLRIITDHEQRSEIMNYSLPYTPNLHLFDCYEDHDIKKFTVMGRDSHSLNISWRFNSHDVNAETSYMNIMKTQIITKSSGNINVHNLGMSCRICHFSITDLDACHQYTVCVKSFFTWRDQKRVSCLNTSTQCWPTVKHGNQLIIVLSIVFASAALIIGIVIINWWFLRRPSRRRLQRSSGGGDDGNGETTNLNMRTSSEELTGSEPSEGGSMHYIAPRCKQYENDAEYMPHQPTSYEEIDTMLKLSQQEVDNAKWPLILAPQGSAVTGATAAAGGAPPPVPSGTARPPLTNSNNVLEIDMLSDNLVADNTPGMLHVEDTNPGGKVVEQMVDLPPKGDSNSSLDTQQHHQLEYSLSSTSTNSISSQQDHVYHIS